MRVALASLLVLVALANADDPDLWIGTDKAKHLVVSSFGTVGGYALLHCVRDVDHKAAIWLSIGAMAGACIGKELLVDSEPSGKDLVYDVVGLAASVVGISAIHHVMRRGKSRTRNHPPLPAGNQARTTRGTAGTTNSSPTNLPKGNRKDINGHPTQSASVGPEGRRGRSDVEAGNDVGGQVDKRDLRN